MYADTLFLEENPSFAPVASWVTNNQQEMPHIMLTLRHEATVDERLLRGELLTIVAAMNSRLSFRYFRRHVVAPVRIIFWIQPLSSHIFKHFIISVPWLTLFSLLLFYDRLWSSHSWITVVEESSRAIMMATRSYSAKANCSTFPMRKRLRSNYSCDIWLQRPLVIPKSSLHLCQHKTLPMGTLYPWTSRNLELNGQESRHLSPRVRKSLEQSSIRRFRFRLRERSLLRVCRLKMHREMGIRVLLLLLLSDGCRLVAWLENQGTVMNGWWWTS